MGRVKEGGGGSSFFGEPRGAEAAWGTGGVLHLRGMSLRGGQHSVSFRVYAKERHAHWSALSPGDQDASCGE